MSISPPNHAEALRDALKASFQQLVGLDPFVRDEQHDIRFYPETVNKDNKGFMPDPQPARMFVVYCAHAENHRCRPGKSRHPVTRGACFLVPDASVLRLPAAEHLLHTLAAPFSTNDKGWIPSVVKRFADDKNKSADMFLNSPDAFKTELAGLQQIFGHEFVLAAFHEENPRRPVLALLRRGVDLCTWLELNADAQKVAAADKDSLSALPLPLPRYCSAAHIDLARALLHAQHRVTELLFHANKGGHGDVKPDNILLYPSTPSAPAGVTFFCNSKQYSVQHIDFEFAAEGEVAVGASVAWASPQQAAGGKSSAVSDCWSLALVLYEILHYRPRSENEQLKPDSLFFHDGPSDADLDALRKLLCAECGDLGKKASGWLEKKASAWQKLAHTERAGQSTLLQQLICSPDQENNPDQNKIRLRMIACLRPLRCTDLTWSLIAPLLMQGATSGATAEDALCVLARLRSQHLLARRMEVLPDALMRLGQIIRHSYGEDEKKFVMDVCDHIPAGTHLSRLPDATVQRMIKARKNGTHADGKEPENSVNRFDHLLPFRADETIIALRNNLAHPSSKSRVASLVMLMTTCDAFMTAFQYALALQGVVSDDTRTFVFPGDDEYAQLQLDDNDVWLRGWWKNELHDKFLARLRETELDECRKDLDIYDRFSIVYHSGDYFGHAESATTYSSNQRQHTAVYTLEGLRALHEMRQHLLLKNGAAAAAAAAAADHTEQDLCVFAKLLTSAYYFFCNVTNKELPQDWTDEVVVRQAALYNIFQTESTPGRKFDLRDASHGWLWTLLPPCAKRKSFLFGGPFNPTCMESIMHVLRQRANKDLACALAVFDKATKDLPADWKRAGWPVGWCGDEKCSIWKALDMSDPCMLCRAARLSVSAKKTCAGLLPPIVGSQERQALSDAAGGMLRMLTSSADLSCADMIREIEKMSDDELKCRAAASVAPALSAEQLAALQAQIDAQAEKVKAIKAAKTAAGVAKQRLNDDPEVKVEVAKLLALKSKMPAAAPAAAAAAAPSMC